MQTPFNVDLGIREIRQITGFLKEKHGVDFSDYALTSFKRRVEDFLNAKRYSLDTLMKNFESKQFIDHFAGRIAVGETEMFRDPSFWILLKNNYISGLLRDGPKVKIWLPLCASGEELYSLTILLKESGWTERVEIYVSSISNETLEEVRNGQMKIEKLEISTKNYSRFQGANQFSDYYKTTANSVIFDRSLLNNVKFFREGLDFSSELPHFNLILFRNKMIYFNSTLQYRVWDLMYGRLAVKGLFVLGILEEIDVNNNKFFPLNKNESVYQRRG